MGRYYTFFFCIIAYIITTSGATTTSYQDWDGAFAEEKVYTNNPAWVFYDILTNNRYGLGDFLKDTDIDSLKVNTSSIIPQLSSIIEEFPEGLFNLDAKTWEATTFGR